MFTEFMSDPAVDTPVLRQPMLPVPYLVRSVRRETHDTYTLTLVSPDGKPFGPYLPGQFNMLYAFGVGEVPISISGDPARPEALVHTVRAVGPVTETICRLKQNDVLGVRGPYGTAWPVKEALGRDVVFVAGGIGLAPLRSALYAILVHRQDYGRVALIYGARTPSDMLYVPEMEEWRGRFDLDVQVIVDAAQPSWRGNVGVVTTLIPKVQFDPGRTMAMICGPEIMMRFSAFELIKAGVGEEAILVSMERNMKCALGYCGHCQLGPEFICKDGPVFAYRRLSRLLGLREV